ncbi:HesA/MoeB/ThiF family protein [Rheinheimera riviphila]|uniref:HesA/MoeB/ThiF family protein n=1 Tax=Rheinheimera riviphila TaxID=1834037 RepID=UPI0013E36A3E|nr:molybdopterin-synthase adenylyltransferase MoeB [Rheinheimera riviphila]
MKLSDVQPMELTLQQALRYSRQIMLPSFELQGQEKLSAAKVLVIGVGGLGCAALPYLASSGVGTLTLVDGDSIDRSNLQRQILFRETDVGQRKATVAAAALRQLNSEINIVAISEFADELLLQQWVAQHDLVLDCSDNLATRLLINRQCYRLQVPLVSAAAIRMEGQISSFLMDGKSACYQCLVGVFGEPQLSCLEAGILSPVVGVVGAMQALEAIKILTGCGTALAGKLLLLDGLHSEWQTFSLSRQPDCACCSASASASASASSSAS